MQGRMGCDQYELIKLYPESNHHVYLLPDIYLKSR